jgi:signal transduction histidine kinase
VISFSRPLNSPFRVYALIAAAGLFAAAVVGIKLGSDLKLARQNYVQEEHFKTLSTARSIEDIFRTIYEGLRIISRLPEIKRLDRHATQFDENSRLAVREIYDNISTRVHLSEIYVTHQQFDPQRQDPYTGRPQEPSVMFDENIPPSETPGSEWFEYRLIKKQIRWFEDNAPAEKIPSAAAGVPAITGPEVVTCDHSDFDAARPDDRKRSGLVYSVPFYSLSHRFKGVVSGIFLSRVFRDVFPDEHFVLISRVNRYYRSKEGLHRVASPWEFVRDARPDPGLIYSEAVRLDVRDSAGDWILWVGRPDSFFWSRRDVAVARQFALMGWLGCLLMTAGLAAGYAMARRHRMRLEGFNWELQKHRFRAEQSREELKKFSGKMLALRETEKHRLARDLHDMVGGMAVSVNANLSVAKREIEKRDFDAAANAVVDTKAKIDEVVGAFKKIAVDLRPPQLETTGLGGVLEEYCANIARQASLDISLENSVSDAEIDSDLTIAVYRIVQESLTNIVKHADADSVVIRLKMDQDRLTLTVSDNGKGFDAGQARSDGESLRMGLLGMRERVESFGGVFSITSKPGTGTHIQVQIPCRSMADNWTVSDGFGL